MSGIELDYLYGSPLFREWGSSRRLEVEGRVRLGFIGCGNHATTMLFPCLPMIPEVELVATCDLVEERARRNCRRFGGLRWYTDYRKMIEEEQLDAVAVVGPPKMHTELGVACLEAGLHVFMEKPPSVDLEGIKHLCEAAKRTGKYGMVATMWRHAQAHKIAKKIIGSPEFGRPVLFQGAFFTPGPRRAIPELGDLEWTYLVQQGIHPVDCMRFLVGDVSEVYAFSEAGKAGVAISASLGFRGRAVGSLSLTGSSPSVETLMYVAGEGGESVRVYNLQFLQYLRAESWAGTPGKYEDLPSLQWSQGDCYKGHGRPGYVEELTHFARCLIRGEQPHASLDDAYEAMRVLQAIHKSIKEGAKTSL